MFIGIYNHPPPAGVGITAVEVKKTWYNEAIEFASAYALKSAIWLARLPPA
jgi:hypothetical protein